MARSEKLGEFGLLLCLRHQGHHALHYFRLAQNAARLEQELDLEHQLVDGRVLVCESEQSSAELEGINQSPGIGSSLHGRRWAAIYSDATIQQT